jgi:hypothetical protein
MEKSNGRRCFMGIRELSPVTSFLIIALRKNKKFKGREMSQ